MVHTCEFKPVGNDSTLLILTVNASGQMEDGWPDVVDSVWRHFLLNSSSPILNLEDTYKNRSMNIINLILGSSFIVTGGIFILISLPLLKGSVKMNNWYGVRFKKAFESDENWLKINKYGSQQLIKCSALLILIGVITMFVPLGHSQTLIIIFSFAPILVIIPAVIRTYRFARRL